MDTLENLNAGSARVGSKRSRLAGERIDAEVNECTGPKCPRQAYSENFEYKEGDKVPQQGLPTDTEVALQILRGQFSQNGKAQVPPLVLRNQIYSLVFDRTQVDRTLDQLRRKNIIRLFKLPTSALDYAVVYTEDYVAKINASRLRAETAGKSTAAAAFTWFRDAVLPACTELSVTQRELEEHFLRSVMDSSHEEGESSRRLVVDEWVTPLMQAGFISRQDSSGTTSAGESHWFSIPNVGPVSKWLVKGRAEITKLLSRRKFTQMLESQLEKHKLLSSSLGMKFHLCDMLGSQLIESSQTTCGKLFKLHT